MTGCGTRVPALTAIDLATFVCSDAIDLALRVRAPESLAGMYQALHMTPHRAGNMEGSAPSRLTK